MATRFYVALIKEVVKRDLNAYSDVAKFQSGDYILVTPLQFQNNLSAAIRALLQEKKSRFRKPKFSEEEVITLVEKAYQQEMDKIQNFTKRAV